MDRDRSIDVAISDYEIIDMSECPSFFTQMVMELQEKGEISKLESLCLKYNVDTITSRSANGSQFAILTSNEWSSVISSNRDAMFGRGEEIIRC